MIESKKAFSVRQGVNKGTVTRWAQTGRLVLDAAGDVDIAASQARLAATEGGRADVAARHAENRGAAIPTPQQSAEKPTAGAKPATTAATSAPPESPAPDLGGGRTKYKAAVLHYENSTIKLGMALARGLRYPLASVRRESMGLGHTVRAAMERLIDQTAPRLAVMTSDLDRRRLIAAELRRLRRMVKSELPRALRRMRNEGSSGKVGAGGTAL